MKKMLAVVAIVMLVPFTAFGLEMMADTALEDVTGQAGVSISVDNIEMDFSIGYVSWGDEDGFGASNPGGFVNMNDIRMTGIVIDKFYGDSGLQQIADAADELGYNELKFLTIDVGTYATGLDAVGDPTGYATAVRIGVPTLHVYVNKIDPIYVSLTATAGADFTAIPNSLLGTIALGEMQLDTKGGAIYILAH